jgi:hypothetical protein
MLKIEIRENRVNRRNPSLSYGYLIRRAPNVAPFYCGVADTLENAYAAVSRVVGLLACYERKVRD